MGYRRSQGKPPAGLNFVASKGDRIYCASGLLAQIPVINYPDISADRLKIALELARTGLWQRDLRTNKAVRTPMVDEMFGFRPGEMGEDAAPFLDRVHPEDRAEMLRRLAEVARSGGFYEMVMRITRPDGVQRWIAGRAEVERDARGEAVRVLSVLRDITEQRQAREALAEEKGRLETLYKVGAVLAAELDLEKLVQAVTDAGVALTKAAFGAFFYNVVDQRGESYTLYALSGAPREAFSRFPKPRNTAVFASTFTGAGVVRSDDITKDERYGRNAPYAGMPDGHLPVRSYLAVPVVSRSGEVLGGLFFGHPAPAVFTENAEHLMTGIAAQAAIAIDNARLFQAAQREIAERKTAEARLTTVAGEVDHRAKNMLALVQAMVRLTKAETLPEYTAALTGRINALAHAHALLAQSRWDGADLMQIVDDELAPYRRNDGANVTVSGPSVRLNPVAAQAVTMAIHELVTNAVKYGALSTPAGRVELSWQLVASSRLTIQWTESGGPPVRKPTRTGFGTTAVDQMIRHQLGGDVRLHWRPEGVACEMVVPIA
jgi:PAS domain S-box-containing protein